MRSDERIRSRIVIGLQPSMLAFLVSSLTRLAIPLICSSALSSIVMILSFSGIKPDKTFRKVVFPLPVPPLIKILYPATTKSRKKSDTSVVMDPSSISLLRSMGCSGKRRIVRIGPFSATGAKTTLTLAPFASLVSTIGLLSFTTRFAFATICWMMSSSFSLLSNRCSNRVILPFFSIKIESGPLTIISVTSSSSNSSCKISSLRIE